MASKNMAIRWSATSDTTPPFKVAVATRLQRISRTHAAAGPCEIGAPCAIVARIRVAMLAPPCRVPCILPESSRGTPRRSSGPMARHTFDLRAILIGQQQNDGTFQSGNLLLQIAACGACGCRNAISCGRPSGWDGAGSIPPGQLTQVVVARGSDRICGCGRNNSGQAEEKALTKRRYVLQLFLT